jgi:N-acetylglutamate synthase and related acetyltransferases
MIRKVNLKDDFVVLAKLLNSAFDTVAKDFGLTKENARNNSAFITGEELKAQLTEIREFYVYEDNGCASGFVAIEKSLNEPGTYYFEKLAVIPESRHLGVGLRLMNFASERAKELGGKRISIALIDSNTILKEWYCKHGFVVFDIKRYDHLHFDVCFMEKEI